MNISKLKLVVILATFVFTGRPSGDDNIRLNKGEEIYIGCFGELQVIPWSDGFQMLTCFAAPEHAESEATASLVLHPEQTRWLVCDDGRGQLIRQIQGNVSRFFCTQWQYSYYFPMVRSE